MIRVAVVMGKMHSGGKKNLVMEYYRHIDRNRVQFDFICDSDSNAIPREEIESLGGKVFMVAPYQHIFRNILQIYRICRKGDYPIIHGYNGSMNMFALFAGMLAGIPIRINESISMAHSGDRKTIPKNILKPFSGWFATDYLANGVCSGIWQFGRRAYDQGRIHIFKTVIDADKNVYDPLLRAEARRELGLEDKLVVGHIGRLTAQKNTLFLIDIFREIASRESRAVLVIIGDGSLREQMLSRIDRYGLSDKVLYLGRREDIRKFYNAMDCFLLPSLYEGLPVVGIESECCGLPIFFSAEIPRESSPCKDLGHFISLKKSPGEWADTVLKYTNKNIPVRRDHSSEIKAAGFDSKTEAAGLMDFYERRAAESGRDRK